jgi:hypothetical protein
VQGLPITDDLEEIQAYLNPRGLTVHQALYYGLLPGLIFDQRKRPYTNSTMENIIRDFNGQTPEYKQYWMLNILRSLFTGDAGQVPLELHFLLTTRPLDSDDYKQTSNLAKISWVPYILNVVLTNTHLKDVKVWHGNFWLEKAKEDLVDLYGSLCGAGKGYEILFAIAYLARSIAGLPFADVLPMHWFDDTNVEVLWDPLCAKHQCVFSDCENWQQLENSIGKNCSQTTIVILFPKYDFLKLYDMIALFVKDQKIVDQRAFQLRQGDDNPRDPPLQELEGVSFLVEGIFQGNGSLWKVIDTEAIKAFLGESGRNFTPEMWNKLNSTFTHDRKKARID